MSDQPPRPDLDAIEARCMCLRHWRMVPKYLQGGPERESDMNLRLRWKLIRTALLVWPLSGVMFGMHIAAPLRVLDDGKLGWVIDSCFIYDTNEDPSLTLGEQ